ncbi:MAG: hypothetical protein E3J86_06850 [Candidatus Thorarchaeota archaeon]|nr:MAG: hypothetical protein E3J86_06850 [Candidatus Thorarchaeota archaeon]
MPDEKKELEDAVMESFEWALADPTDTKLRELGEVVSIITTKLTEAITHIQISIMDIESKLDAMDGRITSLASRAPAAAAAGGGPAAVVDPAGAASDEPIPTMEKAPTPKPTGAPGGGQSMMGELKQLLAARRRKADG